jgi:DNA-binding MarR family transcriptional regulator
MASRAFRRSRIPLSTVRRLEVVRSVQQRQLTPGQVASDLDELEAMGFIEKFKDEHNVTRYRPCLVANRKFA